MPSKFIARSVRPLAIGLTACLLAGAMPVIVHAQTAARDAGAADPQATGARQFVDKLASQAVSFLADQSMSEDQKRDQFRKLLLADYDMATIGRFALGPTWNQLDPAQRNEYQSYFREMIVRVYSARFESYNGQKFKTTGAHPDPQTPGDAIVNSVIIPADGQSAQVQVDWRVRQKGGQYRVVDVIVEGVSMALTQRSDFSSTIQRSGGNIDAFLSQLRGQAAGTVAAPDARPAR